jgi:hypothetical protein
MRPKRWQDWTNAILGLWTVASPWALAFAVSAIMAARASWLLGAGIVVVAAIAVYLPRAEGLNILLGLCLLISPWALSYADLPNPTANAVSIGVLVTVLALWAMVRDAQIQRWWHERHVTR